MNTKDEKIWILLTKKTTGEGFVQSGPFSDEEIKESIRAGKIQYTDFIWKGGFEQWMKISQVEEFKYRPTNKNDVKFDKLQEHSSPQSLGEGKSSDIEENNEKIEVYRASNLRKKSREDEEKPSEAEGENLVASKLSSFVHASDKPDEELVDQRKKILANKTLTMVRATVEDFKSNLSKSRKMVDEDKELSEESSSIENHLDLANSDTAFIEILKTMPAAPILKANKELIREHHRKANSSLSIKSSKIFYGLVFLAIVTIGSVSFYAYNEINKRLGQKNRMETVKEINDEQSVENISGNNAKKQLEQKIKPSYVRFKVKASSGGKVLIQILSDGSSHYPVYIKIFSDPGQVLGRARFYRLLKKYSFSGIWEDVELSLPDGFYRIEVKKGDVFQKRKISSGDAKTLKSRLSLYRKQLAYSHTIERKLAFKVLNAYQKIVEDPLSKNNGLKRIKSIGVERFFSDRVIFDQTVFYPENWIEVKKLGADILSMSDSRDRMRMKNKLSQVRKKFLSENLYL